MVITWLGRAVGVITRKSAAEGLEMIRLVEKAGWVLDRFDGTSHRQYKHPKRPNLVTIAGAEHKELKKGMEARIKRDAGL